MRDFSPVRHLASSLRSLALRGAANFRDFGMLSEAINLEDLLLSNCSARQLSRKLAENLDPDKLEHLQVNGSSFNDLDPLANFNLMAIMVMNTPLRDVAPASQMDSLRLLQLQETQVRDLTPLAGRNIIVALSYGVRYKGRELLDPRRVVEYHSTEGHYYFDDEPPF